jgi:capsular exopolysaccharide synthesis family protein
MSSTVQVLQKSPEPLNLEGVRSVQVRPAPETHLVALTQEQSLGSEQFRVLATRLMHVATNRKLKAIQVVSSVACEGKTLVSVNLATTLARRYRQRVLLVEGDMRRPGLERLLGHIDWMGLAHWWTEGNSSLTPYICQLPDLSIWVLPSGGPYEHPTDVLQSARLRESFSQLIEPFFDWVIVDSAPMFPVADANLWSRLVDGTLLVIREGKTPAKALKRGLAGMDNPNVIGIVLNEASEFDGANSYHQYGFEKPRSFSDFRLVLDHLLSSARELVLKRRHTTAKG